MEVEQWDFGGLGVVRRAMMRVFERNLRAQVDQYLSPFTGVFFALGYDQRKWPCYPRTYTRELTWVGTASNVNETITMQVKITYTLHPLVWDTVTP
jgi:hypothetical protein